MRLGNNTFIGEAPRIAPELLPDNAAQVADECRFLSGNLQAWYDWSTVTGIVKNGYINTVYLMNGQYWLHWTDDELDYDIGAVDVARGPVAGDTTEFTIFTGTDGPRWTNVNLATDEPPPGGVNSGEYPYVSYLLGVPAPSAAPTLTVAQTETQGNVSVTNNGAEDGITGWTVDTGDLDTHTNGDVGGLNADSGTEFFYGGAAAAVTEAYQDIDLSSAGVIVGAQLNLTWAQAEGGNGSQAGMRLEFYDSGDTELTDARVTATVRAATSSLTWEDRSISGTVPDDAEYVRLVMRFVKVGGGENDAYIDSIALDANDASYVSDGSDLEDWTTSTNTSIKSITESDLADGVHDTVFRFFADEQVPYAYKSFSLDGANSFVITMDVYLVHERNVHLATIGAADNGYGDTIGIDRYNGGVFKRTVSDFDDYTGVNSSVISAITGYTGKWLKMTLSGSRSGTSEFAVTVTVTEEDTGTILTNAVETTITTYGDHLVLKHYSNEGGGTAVHYVDNVTVSVTAGDTDDNEDVVLTNYVYTFVNGIGQEGAPSAVSRDVQRSDNTTVTVTTATTADTDYNVETKRIYRAVTQDDGTTVYRLVAEIALATSSYEDDTTDANLEDDILLTTDWDLPPFDSQNVTALPNGVTLLTSKNTIRPSVINYAHAYPVLYQLVTESDIVAVGAIDTSVVIATQTRPYMLLGSDPEGMSMAKFEDPQGCVSKRSMVTMKNYGVIYASPDGLVGITGAGNLRLLTEGYFTRREWQSEVVPASIKGISHDGRYFGSCNGQDSTGRGFLFDPMPEGNGWTWLNFDWQAAFTDPETDQLYFVVDNQLYLWEGDENELRPYTWRSKLHLLPRPVAFRFAQVDADDYLNLTLKLYANGNLFQTKTVTSDREFILASKAARDFEYEITGTSRVRSVQFAESVEEIQ